jgi:hypothetical protein
MTNTLANSPTPPLLTTEGYLESKQENKNGPESMRDSANLILMHAHKN